MKNLVSTSSEKVSLNTIRTEESIPHAYRLVKKPDGTLVLQGSFLWYERLNCGTSWKDIPTVEIGE